MKRALLITAALVPFLCANTITYAQHAQHAQERPKVGGFEQIPPDRTQEQDIGQGWGHRSMTYGMMNLMSGMTSQVASILRTGKASPEMLKRLSDILDHVADMLNYAPAYMMGTKTVDSEMMKQMQEMLMDLENMRKEIQSR